MRPRVLIFDADPSLRQMLKEICHRRGYETLTFPDPGLCPLHVKDECPCEAGISCADFILSDLDLPGIKGLDYVEAVLSKGCQCRHIALFSASWSGPDILRAQALGCTLLIKPIDTQQITQWFEQSEQETLRTRRLQDLESLLQTLGPGETA